MTILLLFSLSVSPLDHAREIQRDLKAQGLYDNMPENWQEVTAAIQEGCQSFIAAPSRLECKRGKCEGYSADPRQKLLYRVLPVRWINHQPIPWIDKGASK